MSLPTNTHIVRAIVFPVVGYGCESWTINQAESQRIDVFELWCWRRLLRVPWTARKSNQSILKEINPEYSLEGLSWSWNSNTSATWCEESAHWKRPWSWARWKARGEEGGRGWDGWMASSTQRTWVWANSGRRWWTGKQRVRCDWVTEQQSVFDPFQVNFCEHLQRKVQFHFEHVVIQFSQHHLLKTILESIF